MDQAKNPFFDDLAKLTKTSMHLIGDSLENVKRQAEGLAELATRKAGMVTSEEFLILKDQVKLLLDQQALLFKRLKKIEQIVEKHDVSVSGSTSQQTKEKTIPSKSRKSSAKKAQGYSKKPMSKTPVLKNQA